MHASWEMFWFAKCTLGWQTLDIKINQIDEHLVLMFYIWHNCTLLLFKMSRKEKTIYNLTDRPSSYMLFGSRSSMRTEPWPTRPHPSELMLRMYPIASLEYRTMDLDWTGLEYRTMDKKRLIWSPLAHSEFCRYIFDVWNNLATH